jgi:hypothetical protein
MNIPIKQQTHLIFGRKTSTEICWVISYDVDFGAWFKRKTTFVIDLQTTVFSANTHLKTYMPLYKQSEQSRQLLNEYEIYINKMKEKKARKDVRKQARKRERILQEELAKELNRLDEAGEKRAARKAGYKLYPI